MGRRRGQGRGGGGRQLQGRRRLQGAVISHANALATLSHSPRELSLDNCDRRAALQLGSAALSVTSHFPLPASHFSEW